MTISLPDKKIIRIPSNYNVKTQMNPDIDKLIVTKPLLFSNRLQSNVHVNGQNQTNIKVEIEMDKLNTLASNISHYPKASMNLSNSYYRAGLSLLFRDRLIMIYRNAFKK